MSIITAVALMLLLTFPEGDCQGDQGMTLRCRCISTENKPIGRYIGKVEVIPANSHCSVIEIIATLKRNGTQVCLNPNAPWVKKVLERMLTVQTS